MKRFMSFAAATIIGAALSTSAFAHSPLKEATPAAGETVVEPLQQVTLQFDGNIEQGSYVDFISSTGDVLQANVAIDGNMLTGSFDEPLPNDSYTVDWSIISEDGHPLEGEYTLTVNAPVVEEVVEDAVTESENEAVATATEEVEAEETVTGPSAGMLLGVAIGVVALVGGVFFFVMRKE